jgi:dihydroorotate dehydrogenase (NAD+) catalytic subunit
MVRTKLENNLLSTNVAGLQLENPTILASGVLGYSAESLNRVAKGGAGGVVTKSIGIEPRVGYPNPTVVQAEAGIINAMGLPNPGINPSPCPSYCERVWLFSR